MHNHLCCTITLDYADYTAACTGSKVTNTNTMLLIALSMFVGAISVSCQCMLAHRTRVQAHLVGT